MKRGWVLLLFLLAALGNVANHARLANASCDEPLPQLFERVSPAVVFISVVSIDPFKVTGRVSMGLGSGFVIDADGLILTNSHVVFGTQAILVTLDHGTKLPAKLVGADPILDLAVVRIPKPKNPLPVSDLGDSNDIKVGEEVIAIGNPLGFDQTLTRGIVSGLHRILSDSPMSLTRAFIQTDAAINPGNSGGPLLDRCGRVVGINTAGIPEAQNMGFAIPINVAKKVLPQLIQEGRVIRPWLGINGQLIGKELRSLLKLPLVDGFLVETVEPGSPAEKAGLKGGRIPITIAGDELLIGGDIITAANGKSLNNPKNYFEFARSLKVGDKVRLRIYREGKKRNVEFLLPERPILPGDLPKD